MSRIEAMRSTVTAPKTLLSASMPMRLAAAILPALLLWAAVQWAL
jgi:hypothetical protein